MQVIQVLSSTVEMLTRFVKINRKQQLTAFDLLPNSKTLALRRLLANSSSQAAAHEIVRTANQVVDQSARSRELQLGASR